MLVTNSYIASYNLDNRNRFIILYDAMKYINASGEPNTAAMVHTKINLNLQTNFNAGVAGTIADIATGSLYLLTLGSAGAGVTAGALTGRARVRFTDN